MAVTFATLWDEFSQMVECLDRDYLAGSGAGGASNSLVANLSALDAVIEDSPQKAAQLAAMLDVRRARSRALISPWLPWFTEWCSKFARFVDAPAEGLSAIPYIWLYFHDNSERVARRNLTRGSWSWITSANSISANNIVSIATDAYGYSIEDAPRYDSTDSDFVHEIECVAGPQNGASIGEFSWTLKGDPADDNLDDPSSFRTGINIVAVDGSVGNLLRNGAFEEALGSGQSKVPGWYIDAQEGSVGLDTDAANGYRAILNTKTISDSDGTFSQLTLAYNATAQPKLTQYIQQPLSPNIPYMLGVTFSGDGTANGNMTLTVGSKSSSASVTSSYQHLWLHASNEEYAWFRQFVDDPMAVSIQRTGSPTTGTVYVHAVYCYPMLSYLGGRYVQIVAGDDEYRQEDLARATDSVGNSTPAGTCQYWWNLFCREFVGGDPVWWYLPSAASATTNAHDYS